ncbi:MAG: hypothetical protein EOO53_13995 [Gammaproteobacteria bacterium]|nr:MAG: hypothetical protein EOO53_13995 [Gammaproteobacteria bacterium]
MKLDKLPNAIKSIPRNQRFFLGCWNNLTDEESVDSDRISVMSAVTGLIELNGLYSLGKTFNGDEKRISVGIEVCALLKKDMLLEKPHYKNIKDQLTALLDKNAKQNNVHSVNGRQILVGSLAKELIQLTNTHYVADALTELSSLLSPVFSLNEDPERDHFYKILQVTHHLIAALIAEGAHLAELSWIYRNVLAKSSPKTFSERFNKLTKILLQEKEQYKVVINLKNHGFSQKVLDYGGHITIGDFGIRNQALGICEATTVLEAKSFYRAANIAHEKLNDILDLLSHPMGRSVIVMGRSYDVELINETAPEKLQLELERLVPNPTYIFSSEKFKKYVESIAAFLVKTSGKKTPIFDAFRLSRIGITSQNLESKFLTYWTALETLTNNVFVTDHAKDLRIADAITPCITIDYINKRLASFLGAFKELNINQVTDKTNIVTNFTSISSLQFFKAMQNRDFCDAVYDATANQPYLQYQFKRFAYYCIFPHKLRDILENHQTKIKWQIQRIYRARNAIVHAGLKVNHLELLCANLEHYLKISLSSITDLLSNSASIESSEECFVRYDYAVSDILKNLKQEGANFDTLYQYLTIHQ